MRVYLYTILMCLFIVSTSCAQQNELKILPGAENTQDYLPLLQGKSVGFVGNQSSLVGNQHLVDFLFAKNIKIQRIFSPEHGFRGVADAGEKIKNSKDVKTGISIVSLYGKHFKPSKEEVQGIDVMVFDIQDVGVRFYTYISTLHYVMEICAEQNIPLIVLDRPNPNAHYVDGPLLEKKYASFVGMHPVPVVYGLTIGEYAKMINGEAWLKGSVKCDLTVIPCRNWNRNQIYDLPVKPSPNLPNALSVALYPSLCFFEGTTVSAGRGTDYPFQCFGHPNMKNDGYSYTPRSIPGASKYPKFKGKVCYGYDLSRCNLVDFRNRKALDLSFLIKAYQQLQANKKFFNTFFRNLAGTNQLKLQIEKGMSEEDIRESWQEDLKAYKNIRKKYLIYPDWE
ncbi:exo-beta-N-acetylmuramidase NamZ family protein [Marinifilum flexuosum]|uniref:exo-beta-N-acetylmuramidase NamZ family protein n=1 Tax=Marinifilum flexuosum TaxID=1117708 RepID=UPI00249459E7|nr:DUF1343 domain-containing protein [Marinifilum flexuosum]